MTLSIRPAEVDDAPEVGKLAGEFQSYLRALGDETDFRWGASEYLRDGFGDNPAFCGVVAELDAKTVGYALFHDGYDTDRGEKVIYLIDLYVAHEYRRQGVGAQMMKHLAQSKARSGAKWMAWSVLKANTESAEFYERLGAKYIDHLHHMFVATDALR